MSRCKDIGITQVYHKPMKFSELKEIVGIHHFGMSEQQYYQYMETE
jgi:hypothetical protein